MPATKSPLHPTQQELLKLLAEHINEPMTIRDLGKRLRVSSPSVVQHHIEQLERKGYLRRNPSNPRDYQVLAESPDRFIAYVNVYGLAACGPVGSVLDGDPVEQIAIGSQLLGFSSVEAFAVRAKGESMSPYIKPGDLVIARRTPVCDSGDVVVCVNNEQALVKKVIIRNGITTLFSLNPDLEKHPPFPAARDFRVEGVVRGVLSHGF